MPVQMSEFKPFSKGTVVANKPLNSNVIEVHLDEHTPYVSGEMTDQTTTYTASGTDANGQAYQDSNLQTISVSATWLPRAGGGNRLTAPDVRRGTEVQVYRFGDTDKYFWEPLTDDSQKRKLETVRYGWSGTTEEFGNDDPSNVSPENYYMLEISTHTGQVSFYTSKKNGELTAYQIQLNTASGVFTFADDQGNSFFMDTANTVFRIVNMLGNAFSMDKKDVTFSIPGNLKFSVAKDVRWDIQGKSDMYVQGGSNIFGNQNINGALGMNGDVTSGATPGGGPGTPGTGTMTIAKAVTFQDTVTMNKTLDVEGQIKTPVAIDAPNVN